LQAGPRGPRASPCGPRAYAGQARAGLRAQYPSPPRIFSAGLRAGPAGQALIATPTGRDERLVKIQSLEMLTCTANL